MQPRAIKNYIAGQFVASKRTFEDINPVDGSVAAVVHEADQAMVDHAVQAARAALGGTWGGRRAVMSIGKFEWIC